MAGLKATRQEADVHKFLLVEHLNNAFENSLVEFFDVEWPVAARLYLFVWYWALAKEAELFLCLVVVFGHLLLAEADQAYMGLIFAAIDELANLLE